MDLKVNATKMVLNIKNQKCNKSKKDIQYLKCGMFEKENI